MIISQILKDLLNMRDKLQNRFEMNSLLAIARNTQPIPAQVRRVLMLYHKNLIVTNAVIIHNNIVIILCTIGKSFLASESCFTTFSTAL